MYLHTHTFYRVGECPRLPVPAPPAVPAPNLHTDRILRRRLSSSAPWCMASAPAPIIPAGRWWCTAGAVDVPRSCFLLSPPGGKTAASLYLPLYIINSHTLPSVSSILALFSGREYMIRRSSSPGNMFIGGWRKNGGWGLFIPGPKNKKGLGKSGKKCFAPL